MTATDANPWLNYWQTLPAGHLLFDPEAEEFARNLLAAVPLDDSLRVLDYGCGYGSVALRIEPYVREIAVWDAAPSMCEAARKTLANVPNATMWDQHAGDFDVIIVNSVVQYMTASELTESLAGWHDLLAPGGRLVLADLSLTNHSAFSDMKSLLVFSLRNRYFLKALRLTLAERTRYDATAKAAPLLRIDPRALEADALRIGFGFQWLPRNLSHFRGRKTAILTRPA